MRKTTSALAAGLLGAGSAVALTLVTPGLASATACGTTTLDQAGFAKNFSTAESRSNGHNEVVDGGLHVYTDGSGDTGPDGNGGTWNTDKAAAYYAIADIALATQTAESNYDLDLVVQTGEKKPGYNLVIDTNGPSVGGGFATLVKEEGLYGDLWWSNSGAVSGVPGGSGYAHLGTVQAYSDANPEATISAFGYSLGSGVKGDVLITKIRFGCNDFAFDIANRAPVANARIDEHSDQDYRTFFYSGTRSTDPDGDKLTYAWDFGDGTTANGAEVEHTYAKGARTYPVTLTVSDGALTNSTTTQVKVTPPADTLAGNPLPNTGANVFGMAALGAVAVAGSGAGLVATRRRSSAKHTA